MDLTPADIHTVVPFRAPDERDVFADELRYRLDVIEASTGPGFAESDVGRYAVVMLSVLRRAANLVAQALEDRLP